MRVIWGPVADLEASGTERETRGAAPESGVIEKRHALEKDRSA